MSVKRTDYAKASKRGGRATANRRRTDADARHSKAGITPSIGEDMAVNIGPQRSGTRSKGFVGAKAWCYIHNEPHSKAQCADYKED